MRQALRRSPKLMLAILFGMVFGMVWAAGTGAGTPVSAQATGTVTQLTAGAGITLTPNPIVSTGTIAAKFGGNGSATNVSRSDHHHDSRYVRKTGDTMSGNLAFTGNTQLVAPRIENASAPPAGAAAGRMWFDTSSSRMMYFDGLHWNPVPQLRTAFLAAPLALTPGSEAWEYAGCEVQIPGGGAVRLEFQAAMDYRFTGPPYYPAETWLEYAVSVDGVVGAPLAAQRVAPNGSIALFDAKYEGALTLGPGLHTLRLMARKRYYFSLDIPFNTATQMLSARMIATRY